MSSTQPTYQPPTIDVEKSADDAFAALLEPASTPSRAPAANISNDQDPTPLRYFLDNVDNDITLPAPDELAAAENTNILDSTDETNSVETEMRERENQLVTLRILGKPFAQHFWFRDWPIAALIGAVLGMLTLAFLVAVHASLDLWFSPSLKRGHWTWLIITTTGGFVCGLLLLIPQAPSVGTVRTMFHDAIDLKGDPTEALWSVLACFVCLATGAPLGPEMAIGAMGSGLASLVASYMRVNCRTEAGWVFSGMAGSLGGLFPCPILGVTLLHELSVAGRPNQMTLDAVVAKENKNQETTMTVEEIDNHDFMEQVTLAGTAAISAYLVLHALLPKSIPWGHVIEIGNDYQPWHIAAAIPLGIVCGLVASFALILLGIFRTIRVKVCELLTAKLGAPKWVGRLLFPTLAGVIHGLLALYNPYLVGSGIPFVAELIQDRESKKDGWLLVMALAKALSMSLSLGFGLVGGPLFPMVFVGLCVGLLFSSILPVSLAVPCCMCATVIFVPIPFTLVFYVAMALSLSVNQMTPIFVATFVASSVTGGLGIVRRLGEKRLGVRSFVDDLMMFEDANDGGSDEGILRQIRNTIFGRGSP